MKVKMVESMVSIITPAYNAGKYIAQTIMSVIAQSYSDWEMIIVNDGSIDNTADIVTQYMQKDERISLINKANEGVALARNTGLEYAKGNYIAFLDSDDLWKPDKLEKQIKFMKENQFAITYTMYQFISEDGRSYGKIVKVPSKMTANRVLKDTSIACLSVLVDRKMVGSFKMPYLTHTEDQITWYEIMRRGYTAYALQENLALYRRSGSSLTGNKAKAAELQWKTYREYFKFSLLKSSYYYICYAIIAVKKHFL